MLNEIDSEDNGSDEEWVCILDEADAKSIDPTAIGGGHMLKVVGLSDEVKKNIRSGETIIYSSNATMHKHQMDCKNQRVAIGTKDKGFPACEQDYLGGMTDEAVCRESKHISGGSYSNEIDREFDYSHRKLKTGERSVLVVRVAEVGGGRTSVPSEAKLVDDVFEDRVSLVSQYAKCSANKLRFVKAADRTARSGGNSINDGVVSLSISTSSSRGTTAMVNSLISKLNSEFNVRSPTALADHIMFCGLPNQNRAFASLNGWYSVYGGSACSSVSTIMHELGHNLGLGHSNDNGREYNDLSGLMGVSYRSDDAPEMCFNAAKNYQLGWFNDRSVVFNPSDITWEGRLVGMSEYTDSRSDDPVVIKLNTASSNDYYLGFNRRSNHNRGTREAIDQVTVVQQSSSRFDRQSDMKAKLGAGREFTISNFDGNSDLRIQVKSINTSAQPAYAEVKISLGCLRDSDCDDGVACNGVETCNRSTNQCVPGTNTGACPLQQTLKTPLCSRCSVINGHMWDVEAKSNDLEITALKYVAYSPNQQVAVYTRRGSHVGFRNSPSGWSRVATVTSPSTFSFGVAEFSSPIIVPSGGRQAFYVTYTGRGGTLTSRGAGRLDAVAASDSYLTIYEGPPKSSPFGYNFNPAPWNGEMIYSVSKSTPSSPAQFPFEVNKSPDTWTQITFDDFERESGLGNFNDGGFDAGYLCDSRTAFNSECSAIIRDGSGSDSSIISDSFSISPYGSIRVQFMYAAIDMEIGEQFVLEYRTNNNASSWKTGKIWSRGTDFANDAWLSASAEIDGAVISGGATMQIRFRCIGSSNYDSILLDDVTVEGK